MPDIPNKRLFYLLDFSSRCACAVAGYTLAKQSPRWGVPILIATMIVTTPTFGSDSNN
jgi:hypothetical protein